MRTWCVNKLLSQDDDEIPKTKHSDYEWQAWISPKTPISAAILEEPCKVFATPLIASCKDDATCTVLELCKLMETLRRVDPSSAALPWKTTSYVYLVYAYPVRSPNAWMQYLLKPQALEASPTLFSVVIRKNRVVSCFEI